MAFYPPLPTMANGQVIVDLTGPKPPKPVNTYELQLGLKFTMANWRMHIAPQRITARVARELEGSCEGYDDEVVTGGKRKRARLMEEERRRKREAEARAAARKEAEERALALKKEAEARAFAQRRAEEAQAGAKAREAEARALARKAAFARACAQREAEEQQRAIEQRAVELEEARRDVDELLAGFMGQNAAGFETEKLAHPAAGHAAMVQSNAPHMRMPNTQQRPAIEPVASGLMAHSMDPATSAGSAAPRPAAWSNTPRFTTPSVVQEVIVPSDVPRVPTQNGASEFAGQYGPPQMALRYMDPEFAAQYMAPGPGLTAPSTGSRSTTQSVVPTSTMQHMDPRIAMQSMAPQVAPQSMSPAAAMRPPYARDPSERYYPVGASQNGVASIMPEPVAPSFNSGIAAPRTPYRHVASPSQSLQPAAVAGQKRKHAEPEESEFSQKRVAVDRETAGAWSEQATLAPMRPRTRMVPQPRGVVRGSPVLPAAAGAAQESGVRAREAAMRAQGPSSWQGNVTAGPSAEDLAWL